MIPAVAPMAWDDPWDLLLNHFGTEANLARYMGLDRRTIPKWIYCGVTPTPENRAALRVIFHRLGLPDYYDNDEMWNWDWARTHPK